ncbi:Uncharacterised protein [Vibrio cholerae]|nr:Uncharacterised protein [Vibrio cholerae]CSC86662.1 Uncharacterised protein [Vibrio cholerae]
MGRNLRLAPNHHHFRPRSHQIHSQDQSLKSSLLGWGILKHS